MKCSKTTFTMNEINLVTLQRDWDEKKTGFFIFYFFNIFVFHLVAVKNEDILNDASHFKLARSVLKIASFEFANSACAVFTCSTFRYTCMCCFHQ